MVTKGMVVIFIMDGQKVTIMVNCCVKLTYNFFDDQINKHKEPDAL